MEFDELNKRANEVFYLDEGDYVIEVSGDTYSTRVRMVDKNFCEFDLMPDMSDRPQALDYLLGKRDDFNDQKGDTSV